MADLYRSCLDLAPLSHVPDYDAGAYYGVPLEVGAVREHAGRAHLAAALRHAYAAHLKGLAHEPRHKQRDCDKSQRPVHALHPHTQDF